MGIDCSFCGRPITTHPCFCDKAEEYRMNIGKSGKCMGKTTGYCRECNSIVYVSLYNGSIKPMLYSCSECGEIIGEENVDIIKERSTTNTGTKQKVEQSRSNELSEAHWKYICELLETHNTPTLTVELIGFHYRTAFEHGYKHAIEDKKLDE